MSRYVSHLIVYALLFALAGACQEDGAEIQQKSTARLVWTGDPAADGCGFFVQVGDVEFKPENENIIPETFKQYNVSKVIITYSHAGQRVRYSCGFASDAMGDGIRLTSIRKDD